VPTRRQALMRTSAPGALRVADRWPSLRARLALPPCSSGRELRGTSLSAPPMVIGSTDSGIALVAFTSPSKTLSFSHGPFPSRSRWRRLSALHRDLSGPGSSLGVVQRSPLRRHENQLSTPGSHALPTACRVALPLLQAGSGMSPFDLSLPRSRYVPLLPFLPASAAFSSCFLAGLLHPAADHEVRQVAGSFSETAIPSAAQCLVPKHMLLHGELYWVRSRRS